MTIDDLPPGISLETRETESFVVLVWRAIEGAVMPNRAGFQHPHTTRCVAGTVEFRYLDGERVRLRAGQEIVLDLGRGYEALAVEGTREDPTEVRCFYPKRVPGAVEEIAHLRTDRRIGLRSEEVTR